jgi:hypothetical protein
MSSVVFKYFLRGVVTVITAVGATIVVVEVAIFLLPLRSSFSS